MTKVHKRKIFFITTTLCFGLSIVLISALRVSQSQIQAAENVEQVKTNKTTKDNKMAEEAVNEKTKVNYYLPYPGILPDHPLYWLKMVRDKTLLWLTRDSEKRMTRVLLYADKRLGAAKVLIEGGKPQLGMTTMTKGEKYLEQAITQFINLKKQGRAIPELKDKLKRATLKHLEVLNQILADVPDQSKAVIEETIKKTEQNLEQLTRVK